MPNYSKHEIVLVGYPFSDLTGTKVRPAVVVNTRITRFVCCCSNEQDRKSFTMRVCLRRMEKSRIECANGGQARYLHNKGNTRQKARRQTSGSRR